MLVVGSVHCAPSLSLSLSLSGKYYAPSPYWRATLEGGVAVRFRRKRRAPAGLLSKVAVGVQLTHRWGKRDVSAPMQGAGTAPQANVQCLSQRDFFPFSFCRA